MGNTSKKSRNPSNNLLFKNQFLDTCPEIYQKLDASYLVSNKNVSFSNKTNIPERIPMKEAQKKNLDDLQEIKSSVRFLNKFLSLNTHLEVVFFLFIFDLREIR